jgi:hypothetical protein
MSNVLPVLLGIVCVLSVAGTLVMYYFKLKSDDKIKLYEQKLIQKDSFISEFEKKHAKITNTSPTPAKIQPQQTDEKKHELISLRKEIAHTKDELKKLKLSYAEKEKTLLEKIEKLGLSSEPMVLENLEMKKAVSHHRDSLKTHLEANVNLKQQIAKLEQQLQKKLEINNSQPVPKQQPTETASQKHDTEKVKQEVLKLKASLNLQKEDLIKLSKENKKWKERALEGRKMYQLMRQLRNMSDEKLTSYQEIVKNLASVIVSKEQLELSQNEKDADFLIPLVIKTLESNKQVS